MVWQLAGKRASLCSGDLQAEIDLAPSLGGVSQIVLRGAAQNRLRLFQLAAAGPGRGAERVLAESYVRGVDLVASYAETSEAPVSLEIYFRVLTDVAPRCGVELWVSSQTSRLESDPQLACASRLPVCDSFRLDDPETGQFAPLTFAGKDPVQLTRESGSGAFLFRLPGTDWSYGEMVHPADFIAATIQPEDGGWSLLHQIFAREYLEKGVIRRARLRGLFVPRQDDEKHIAEAYHLFAASELPLTA